MPRNEFRLRTLIRLRESHRDTQRGRLAEAIQAAAKLDRQREELVAEIGELLENRREITGAASPDVARLLDTQRYEAAVRSRIGAIDADREKVAEEVERRRLQLVEADRAVGVLEKLEERHVENERAEERRREAAQMDEIATTRALAQRTALRRRRQH